MKPNLAGNCKAETSSWMNQVQLVASEPLKSGDVIVSEAPLVSASYKDYKFDSTAWSLTNSVLANSKIKDAYLSLNLRVTNFPMELTDKMQVLSLAEKYNVDSEHVRKIYFGVGTNNIAYFGKDRTVLGHAIFPLLSRANHSCKPTAKLMPGDRVSQKVMLVATQNIPKGGQVTWNYAASNDFLRADIFTRRKLLRAHFWFECACDRCSSEST